MFGSWAAKEVLRYLYPVLSKIGKMSCLGDKVHGLWSESKEKGVAPPL
jgi:hypothetical protein